ncbi:MAG: GatB/YqeY domain-containing protein [Pseudomonadota bacterium]
MDLRARLSDGVKDAMKAKDSQRLSTLRLINAALKEKDIVARSEGRGDHVGEAEILALLGKMVKQRQESARVYEEGGRIELAEQELQEIGIIEDYLPRQLDAAETEAAISEAIEEVGAESLRDMGPVMGALKAKFTGRMDFGKVGPLVKSRLG